MSMWRRLTFLAVLGVLTAAVPAPAAEIKFPPLTGRVVDGAGLLSRAASDRLTAMLAAHEKKTSNQLVVVTLASLQGRPIEDFGNRLLRHWGIGQKGKNNGVLLIVAPAERKVRIEVGYGLEGTLPDATAKSIIERVFVPHFKAQRFEAGIVGSAEALLGILEGSPWTAESDQETDTGDVLFIVLWVVLVAFVLIGKHRQNRRRRRLRRDGVWIADPIHDHSRGYGGGFGGGGFSGGGGGGGGGGASGGW